MRNDIKVKSILKKADYPIIKYGGHCKNRVIADGIDVIQYCGIVVVSLRGFAPEDKITKLLDNINCVVYP